MATIHDHMIAQKRVEWQRAGIPASDVGLALKSGIDARDLAALRRFTEDRNLLVVVRCPKAAAVVWHGILPAKTWATKKKTGPSGAVARDQDFASWSEEEQRSHPQPRIAMVSDYDLMSIWTGSGRGWQKLFVSPLPMGRPRGPFPRAARNLIRDLNAHLISRIQHGCQDDWWNPENPGVSGSDRFAAVRAGVAEFLPDPSSCAAYYGNHGLDWPYDERGRHRATTGR